MMHNKGNTESSYLSDINPHIFCSVITIIMMMIEIHKQQWLGRAIYVWQHKRASLRDDVEVLQFNIFHGPLTKLG